MGWVRDSKAEVLASEAKRIRGKAAPASSLSFMSLVAVPDGRARSRTGL